MGDNDQKEIFARLFAQHERRVYSYIFSLLGDWSAAEDVFQDTCVVMWSKFSDFQLGTDFAGWACRIAHFRVLKYRERRYRGLTFVSEQFLEKVATARESEKDMQATANWLARLSKCVDRLTMQDRELIVRRYSDNCTIKELAAKLNIPANTAYKAIRRIRRELFDCVERTLAQEEHP
jgi:RNA polymerase sigma-70 factor, ECF subfamily